MWGRCIILPLLLISFNILSGKHQHYQEEHQGDVAKKLQLAKELKNDFQYERALRAYRSVLTEDPENFEATWNFSFLLSEIGNRIKNQSKRKYFYVLSEKYAKQAYAMNKESANANFVMATALGRKMELAGFHGKLEIAKEMKYYVERAISIDPKHHNSWFILGLWYFELCTLSQIEKSAAQTVLGDLLKEASLENAKYAFGMALKLNQERISFHYYYALSLFKLNKVYKAKAILKKALMLPTKTYFDSDNIKKCKELLGKL